MKIQKIERGVHTIELYACNLKYEQVQKVMDWLVEEKQLQIVRRDPFNIDRHAKSDFLIASGVRIHIYQSHDKSNGLGLVINPSSLLAGSYQPTQLFIPKRKPAGKCCFRQRRYCMSCVWRTMPVPEDLSFSLKNSASARWT